MRLKRLELLGFKSFAQKTVFEFPKGITGLVGPNGCGKSNVVDAIRWVLGEQRARQLRGNEMSDVIFGGTSRRKALGFAEVTLTFDNADRSLEHDADEVSVTRRLFRSGESEYLINNTPVRLRDIRDLFMDTGIGVSAYSIIEQGAVAFLLTAGKNERRQIFEEAAGISKYKAKKKMAESKLERAEQNLLRLRDIVDEVDRRLRSVRMQASRAARWKAYTEELRDLRMTLYARQFKDFSGRHEEVLKNLERERGRHSSIESNLALLDANQGSLALKLAQYQEKLNGLYGRRSEQTTQLEVLAEQLRALQARLLDLERERQDAVRQIDDHRAKEAEAAASIGETRRRMEEASVALAEARRRMDEITLRLETARRELDDAHRSVEGHRSRLTEILFDETKVSNRLAGLDSERNSAQAVIDRLKMKTAEIAAEIERLSGERLKLAESVDALRSGLARLNEEHTGFARQLETLYAEQDRQRQAEAALRDELTRKESRRDVLRGLEARREGVAGAVRKILDEGAAGNLPGIRGIVADFVDVDPAFARAIEVILGERSQAVVTGTVEEAFHLAREVRRREITGVRFIALESACAQDAPAEAPQGARYASEVLRGAPDALRLLRHLLGSSLIAADLDAARNICAGADGRRRVATLFGDMLDTDGSLVVGVVGEGAGIISRRGELKQLDGEIAELGAFMAEKSAAIARLRERCGELRSAQEDTLRRAEKVRQDLASVETQIMRSEERERHLTDERVVTEQERRELEKKLSELAGQLDSLNAERRAVAARREECEKVLREADETVRLRSDGVKALEVEFAGARVASVQHASERDGLARSLEVLERNLAERRAGIERLGRSVEEGERRRLDAEAQTLANRARDGEIRSSISALAEEIGALEIEHGALRGEIAEADALARKERSDLRQIDEELHRLDLARQELALKIETLSARAREQYELDLAAHAANFVEPEGCNWAEMERHAEEINDKIRKLGPVNVEALDEQTELEIRTEQLKNQEADILKAVADLREIIRRNNAICIERFSATFEEVRTNFHEMFRKLFGSGRADILLEDPSDVLESGIEIIAKPPGKEPTSLSLISGGEKALTAVALLFAIFKTRPSPFCLMDEVDAPLDENNIERFVSVLREYTRTTQFVVITHSKRTMAMADCLYGVTMEEAGVSKRVSVRFEQIETAQTTEGVTVTGMHIRLAEGGQIQVNKFEVKPTPPEAADLPGGVVAQAGAEQSPL